MRGNISEMGRNDLREKAVFWNNKADECDARIRELRKRIAECEKEIALCKDQIRRESERMGLFQRESFVYLEEFQKAESKARGAS